MRRGDRGRVGPARSTCFPVPSFGSEVPVFPPNKVFNTQVVQCFPNLRCWHSWIEWQRLLFAGGQFTCDQPNDATILGHNRPATVARASDRHEEKVLLVILARYRRINTDAWLQH